jgi:CRISPR-associated endonuclease/helicase Cas3
MKPSCWPDNLNDIRAKSAEMGGETLAQHTWDVLHKLAELHQLRPNLPHLIEIPRLWHYLFWTCLLHDFGKAAPGFQGMLRHEGLWKERHEVLSLVFFDWIASGLTQAEQNWIVAAIVSHHRDAKTIQELYADVDPDPLVPLLADVDPLVTSKLWHWIDTCATAWITDLGFTAAEVQPIPLMPHDQAVERVRQHGIRRVRSWLYRYETWLDDLSYPMSAQQVVLPILLRGLTTSADHMASAHLHQMPSSVQENWEHLAARILAPLKVKNPAVEPYEHQKTSAGASSRSAILIAPTGSGKTEAALYWALGDGTAPVPRLFYALPYQASMNAMFDRLKDTTRGFGEAAVGLQHGRALQALYARLIDQDIAPRAAVDLSKLARTMNKLNARPVKVFSPYQMLKAAFQLRGFEAMLSDYAQAAFIFDEIHAYDPERLALILAMVAYLRENFGARFFIMSATFPKLIRDKLAEALGSYATMSASQKVFAKFRRHRLHLLDGELTDAGIDRIVADVRAGKKVLACANTVRRAQEVREKLLAAGLASDQIVLIHSRYIIKHRTEREEEIMRRCELGVAGQTAFVLVATQVIEVSLNIDLDTMYTDPAPLEALLQRFGRVNRACAKGMCPVHVFRQPDDGQYVYGRHKDEQQRGHIVRVTLKELDKHDGQEIDEAAINTWLDAIYNDAQLQAQWTEAYQRIAQSAAQMLANLRPFNSDPQKEDEFEQLFDNVDVLPECFERDYLKHIANHEFIEASRYFVGISAQKYAILCSKGQVRPVDDPTAKRRRWVVKLPYDDEMGLMFEASSHDPDWD